MSLVFRCFSSLASFLMVFIFAGSIIGSVYGAVTDPTGAVIPKANVAVKNTAQ